MLINFQGASAIDLGMGWDRHSLTAFGGSAALVIGGALLLEDAGAVVVPMLGMVGGIAAMALANRSGLSSE
jgi:hypothetical protein